MTSEKEVNQAELEARTLCLGLDSASNGMDGDLFRIREHLEIYVYNSSVSSLSGLTLLIFYDTNNYYQ
jgi:hypothetical protein